MHIHRYWFKFDNSGNYPQILSIGCGVTGVDAEDAKQIISSLFFNGNALPPIILLIEDVDISSLDTLHVIPNIGSVVTRGVWFPKLQ